MPPNTPPVQTPSQMQKPSGGSGPVIGILVILVVLCVGAFYFWGEHLNKQSQNNPPPYIPADTTINVNASSSLD